jgi:hypothetical protein
MCVKGCGRGKFSRRKPGRTTGIQPAKTSPGASSELMRSIETPGNYSCPRRNAVFEIVHLLNYVL